MIESQTTRSCYSTEEYNEKPNDYTDIIGQKSFLNGFIGLIASIAKNIKILQTTYVHINPHIKSRYHLIIAEMYIMINIIVINITSSIVMIFM